jgi:hypothetical protein
MSIDEDHIDFVSGALDSCISARVYKDESAGNGHGAKAGANGDAR